MRTLISREHIVISAIIWKLVATSLSLVMPWCMVQIVDRGLESRQYSVLWLWLGIAAVTQIFAGIAGYIGQCKVSEHSRTREKSRFDSLYRHICQADVRSFSGESQGEWMGQILSSASTERSFVEALYGTGLPLLLTLVGTLAILVGLSLPLTLLSLITIPVAGVFWLWLKKHLRADLNNYYRIWDALYRNLAVSFRALLSIRALHQTDKFIHTFEDTTQKYRDAGNRLQKRQSVQSPFFDMMQAVCLIAIFGFGAHLIFENHLTVGVLIGFQIYVFRLLGLLRNGTSLYSAWQNYVEGKKRWEIIESLPAASEVIFEKAQSPEVLRVSEMDFSFGSNQIWNHFSLVIHEGEFKSILMPSGGGKTTLARCILGIYPLDGGSIALPEANTNTLGFVPQENVLFNSSIRENIEFTCTEPISDAEYQDLLKICALEGVVQRFDDTPLGDLGIRLSGGEQRRVMLARALAHHPQLLIIDQLSSDLEPELCKSIFGNIRESYPKLAILYLGHRQPEGF